MAEEHIYDIGNTLPASFFDSDKFFDENFCSIFNRKELLATSWAKEWGRVASFE